jgi:putative transposase
MALLNHNTRSKEILNPRRYFFVTTNTSMGRHLLQSERNANLLIDTLRSLMVEGKFILHDFVIMPDHLHLLLEVDHKTTIEKAMQFIKGRYSHRIKSECGYLGEVWQRGFAEKQVKTEADMEACRKYIAQNPVKAGLASEIDEFPFCFGYLARIKQGLKPGSH